MSGYPEHNYPAFYEAERCLREAGFSNLVNPANHSDGVGQDLPYSYYIRESILDVLKVSGMIILPGWQDSEGACLEIKIAELLGYPIYTLAKIWDKILF